MQNQTKKNLFIIFFSFCIFFCFTFNKALATTLEVSYPVLSTGSTVTETTQLTEYLKYVFDFGMFVGFAAVFYSLVYAGVLFLVLPFNPNSKADAMDKVYGALSGLLILTLLYLIITTINPQLKLFKASSINAPEESEDKKRGDGLYLYKNSDCDDSNEEDVSTPYKISVPIFNENFKNKTSSVGIVQNTDDNIYYVSVLFDTMNYEGKCFYVNPNSNCQNQFKPIWASAAVYAYDFNPNGDGVTFYRKSYFNQAGGYYKVSNSEIASQGIYIESLENLHFTGVKGGECTVPKDEQDCVLWNDKKTICEKRECPKLSGENITSIQINGNYFVLPIYFGPQDSPSGPWTYCQGFPTENDIKKLGPRQIKWETIRNNFGVIPNYILIIPVKSYSSES